MYCPKVFVLFFFHCQVPGSLGHVLPYVITPSVGSSLHGTSASLTDYWLSPCWAVDTSHMPPPLRPVPTCSSHVVRGLASPGGGTELVGGTADTTQRAASSPGPFLLQLIRFCGSAMFAGARDPLVARPTRPPTGSRHRHLTALLFGKVPHCDAGTSAIGTIFRFCFLMINNNTPSHLTELANQYYIMLKKRGMTNSSIFRGDPPYETREGISGNKYIQ